jgi:chemotaxis-related protein WspD
LESNDDKKELQIDDCWNRIGVWRQTDERCPELDRFIHCRNCSVYSAIGRKLLNREPPEEYRNEWTKILSKKKKKVSVNVKSAFVFRAGGEWLALPANMINEVVNMGPIHSIPNINNKVLRGVVNIHGKLELCVSIGRVLGIEKLEKPDEAEDPDYISPERLVVVMQNNHIITFPVSEVLGIVRYTPEMIKDLPVTVSGSKAAYTMGILCIEKRDVGLLKDKPLFKTLTKDLE